MVDLCCMANPAGEIGQLREEELPVVRVIVPPDPSGPVFEDDLDPGDLVVDGKRTPMLVWHERYPVGHPRLAGRRYHRLHMPRTGPGTARDLAATGADLADRQPGLSPAERRCHVGEDGVDDVGVVVDAELVGHGEQQRVGGCDRLVLLDRSCGQFDA
jgi:hypothetical protein